MTLHNEQDAIKQAVEAGWLPHPNWKGIAADEIVKWCTAKTTTADVQFNLAYCLQDPAFWQALGKAQGDVPGWRHDGDWLYHALRYFEVKLSGGDLNQFWTSLP